MPPSPPKAGSPSAMEAFHAQVGRRYGLFDYVGHPEAERVIVMMGSGAETAHETVEWLVERGERVGLVKVRLYRPFSLGHFLKALPRTAQAVAALDVILDQAESLEDVPLASQSVSAKSTGRGASSTTKAATGKAYKALRKLVEEQCNDKQLMHCELKKARAADGETRRGAARGFPGSTFGASPSSMGPGTKDDAAVTARRRRRGRWCRLARWR